MSETINCFQLIAAKHWLDFVHFLRLFYFFKVLSELVKDLICIHPHLIHLLLM